MTATIFVVSWTGKEARATEKATVPSITADNLYDYFQRGLGWGAGQNGVFINSKGTIVLEWGWRSGHKSVKNIPPYVKGWEKYASKQKVAEYKKRGY